MLFRKIHPSDTLKFSKGVCIFFTRFVLIIWNIKSMEHVLENLFVSNQLSDGKYDWKIVSDLFDIGIDIVDDRYHCSTNIVTEIYT